MAAADHNRLVTPLSSNSNRTIVTSILSYLTLGMAFGLLASGSESFWVVFPVGFGSILPIPLGLVVVMTSTDDGENPLLPSSRLVHQRFRIEREPDDSG
jgi:hypothetical protein